MGESINNKWPVVIGVGLLVGLAIAAIDNLAFEGECSPIVMVGMLFITGIAAGVAWRWRRWVTAALASVCIPLAHVVKHIFGLHDTIQPNTYGSIFGVGVLTLVVATIGALLGVLIRRLTTGPANKVS